MRITSMTIELTYADSAVAQFLVRAMVDGSADGGVLKGRVVGPQCPGRTTIEIAYVLETLEISEASVTLKGVIPEPNVWTAEAPFLYEVTVEVLVDGRRMDSRTSKLALRHNSPSLPNPSLPAVEGA
jgi:beta-galactosidase/beta-glucuronidase